MEFNDETLKLRIKISPKEETSTKLLFSNEKIYSKWKDFLMRYSSDQHDQKFKILKKIGKGKFSTVYLI